MKILLVAIPNHHFFQWANQLKESGYEVYWFDITDGAGFVEKIDWVKQFNGWKLKWDFPFRYRIKKQFPRFYSLIEKLTTNNTEVVFEKIINQMQPDVVHCFEMKLAGLPILSVMQKHNIPLVYSSWGSDMYAYQNLGIKKYDVQTFLKRVNYLITDCERDFKKAKMLRYENHFLGVFPGNGGIETEKEYIKPVNERNTICIKGYDDGVGKAIVVLKAIESIQLNNSIDFLIFSADTIVQDYIKQSEYFKSKRIEIITRDSFIPNKLLLRKFGECLLYVGNSSSDGMPNSLLEAMGMGVFPIQSNPGNATEEVIKHGMNGFLIENTDDIDSIANLLKKALENQEIRSLAQEYNINFVAENYNREQLKDKIVSLYQYLE